MNGLNYRKVCRTTPNKEVFMETAALEEAQTESRHLQWQDDLDHPQAASVLTPQEIRTFHPSTFNCCMGYTVAVEIKSILIPKN